MSFLNLRTTRKGATGERIIEQWIKAKGWQYEAAPDRAHKVDFHVNMDGEQIAIEVKTYARRYSSTDTGIDVKDYSTYYHMHVRVLLLFVDPFEGAIYGQWVNRLAVDSSGAGKVYFRLHQFKLLRALTASEQAELSKYPLPGNYAHTRRYFTGKRQAAKHS